MWLQALFLILLLAHFSDGSEPEPYSVATLSQSNSTSLHLQRSKARHYVFVHGAAHGAWCWYKVSSLLKAAGHRVTALDMKACGSNPTTPDSVSSLLDYSAPLLDFIGALSPEERVVLVGHSFGGYSISVAMERYPGKISVGVFLAAAMPPPSSFNHYSVQNSLKNFQPTKRYYYGNGLNNPATAFVYSPAFYKSVYYRLSPPEDFELGMALWRYWPTKAGEKDGVVLTERNYGGVRRVYVVCDPTVDMDWQMAYINGFPPEKVVTLVDSDHMAMFSQAKALVNTLVSVGANYYSPHG